MPGLKPMFRNSLSAEGAKAVTIKAWAPKARMLMPNSGRFVRLCVRLTILNLLKVFMNLYLRFLHFKFLKFLNRLYIYGSNGLWSGAAPISDSIFQPHVWAMLIEHSSSFHINLIWTNHDFAYKLPHCTVASLSLADGNVTLWSASTITSGCAMLLQRE